MDKYFSIATPPANDPIRCTYKAFEVDGPKFLFVNLTKVESSVHYLSVDDKATLTIRGIKLGKRGRNVDIRASSSQHVVTSYRNLTIEQCDELYMAVCALGIITEVKGEIAGVTQWTVLGSPLAKNVKTLDIPVFLKK